MKQCPQCHQQFTEAWISFCSNDGSILVEVQPQTAAPPRPAATPYQPPDPWGANQPQGWVAPDERPLRQAWQPPPPPAPIVRGPSQALAIASMCTGLIGLVAGLFCFGPFPGIVALILGIVALSQIKKNPGRIGGKPFAIVGVVTGGLNLSFYGVMLVWIIVQAVIN